ncbi:MAG: T9SS type A sorting domain-containing protein [Bacteroidota bacterium]|nr:T9SS type A sorting domain-containing protein [Bacteroidota bacterium]MDP3143774.1 T9SS type A sorting domain-containing protein [Bacteroidota bacterium]
MRFIMILAGFFLLANNAKSQTYNYYFGNLHSHTALSDGNKDSATSGVNNPTGAYAYAKLSQNFNFLGVSEHNHYSNSKNPGFRKQSYAPGLTMADNANQDGIFLSLFGMEWGVSSSYNGHLVIYGFNQLIGWETSAPGVIGNNYDIFNAKTDYDGIFKKIKDNPNAFCYLAHPGFSDYTTNGASATSLAYAPYNATYDSAVVGTPLRSGLAFSTFTDYSDYPTGDYFAYYTKLLSVGYHLGIGYDHDNHYTTFGRSNGGRLVVLMPSLTRANLTTAMQQMHFYGSDDWNAKIDFNMQGNIMGSILSGSINPVFNVVHNDMDGEQAQSIKIWKGTNDHTNTLPVVVYSNTNNNTLTYNDQSGMIQNMEYYYFAEIKQADGNWIVTSPIWYTNTSPTPIGIGFEEYKKDFEFNFFPNPVNQNLNISMTDCDEYSISLIDVTGRLVLENFFYDDHISLNLSDITPGIYTLEIKSKSATKFKKLIVE